MKWIQAKVFFEADDPVIATELISDIFHDLQTQGVVMEEPGRNPSEDWAEEAVDMPDYWAVTGYFPDSAMGEKRRRELERRLERLRRMNHFLYRLDYGRMDEEDWAHSWKRFFFPKKIGKRIVIKPTWHVYETQPNDIVIEIDPGMAFGTGTHPTTALCVQLLEEYLRPGDSLLDVGTGSGILMMAAEKLGASKVVGIDFDETAIEVARQNLIRNVTSPDKFRLAVGNLTDPVKGAFNIVIANILSEVIVVLLDSVSRVMADNAFFICSGIIEQNEKTVVEKMQKNGFRVHRVKRMDSWVAVVASALSGNSGGDR